LLSAQDFTTFLLFSNFSVAAQVGGAIANYGTLTVKYGNFTGNSAATVIVPSLAIFLPGISQLFFSFLTFLLLFAQRGGAIANYGTLTVKYGNFTSNSADTNVCVISPHSKCPYQTMLEIPARDFHNFSSLF
jgi:hypothetical protein